MPASVRWAVFRAAVACVFIACAPTTIESSRWWHSPRLTAALKLSRGQRAALDEIYWRTLPERRARAADAEAAAAKLNRLLPSDVEEAEIATAVSEAADAVAARNRLRTLLLYRMGRVLTPRQREQCNALRLTTPRE